MATPTAFRFDGDNAAAQAVARKQAARMIMVVSAWAHSIGASGSRGCKLGKRRSSAPGRSPK